MINPELRKVEVFRDDAWVVCRLSEVKKNEMFRIYEDDVLLGGTSFIAVNDGYVNENGIGTVEIS